MAIPSIQFAKLDLSGATTTIYSTASNSNSFIRITGDFTLGSNVVTNVDNNNYPTYFGTSSILPGMYLASTGEITGAVRIENWDNNTKTITLSENAIASGTAQVARISPPKGMYFVKSGSISKLGSGDPQNWNSITGSEDVNYDPASLTWGVAANLAPLTLPTNGIIGEYGQYLITKITDRIGTTYANFFITSSNEIPSLKEPNDKVITVPQTTMFISEMYNNTLTIAAGTDAGVGQGYGLAGYQTGLVSFASQSGGTGAGFPFTGSADITGSLQVTGSTVFSTQEGGIDFFTIKSGSVDPIKFNGEGVMQFAGLDFTPTPIDGGIFFSASQFWLGIGE